VIVKKYCPVNILFVPSGDWRFIIYSELTTVLETLLFAFSRYAAFTLVFVLQHDCHFNDQSNGT